MITEQQKKFADLYITTGNAKQSYIEAGYKARDNVAEVNASRLLRNAKVMEYIEQQNKAIQSDRIATMEEVKKFWTDTLRDEGIDPKHRLKASEYIAKTNAAFIEKQEITGEMKQSVTHDLSKLSVEELKQIESILSKTE
jgi:phage terminase small subunit